MSSKRMSLIRSPQSGLALVIVLWVLTLLTLMAGSFAMTMRRDNSVSLALKNNAEALAQAESGIILAQFMLAQTEPELRWQADGTVYRLLKPDSEVRIRILSEAGKIDINTSNETQLTALLAAVVKDDWEQQRLLNAILDWRDADDDTRTLGAERRQYQMARLSYGPSNQAFQTLEELQLVLGMNEAIFTAIQPFITLYSGQAEVNINTASPELLSLLASELKKRNIQDVALENRLAKTVEANVDAEAGASLAGESETYTILAEAMVHDEAVAGLEVVVKSQGGEADMPYQILDWKQNVQGPSLFDEAMGYAVITIQDEFRYDDRY